MIGPLFIRAGVGPELKPVVVEILWSVAVPPGRTAGDLGQDLYLLWPGGLFADPAVGKPDPACYLLAAAQLGVDPTRCVVVEDTAAGVRAGRAAGARVVVRGDAASPETAGLHRLTDYRRATVTLHEESPRIRGSW